MSIPRPHIQIILGTTREGRRGERVAKRVFEVVRERADLSTELIDLRDWPMPLFDQPKSPASGEYTAEYQRKWAERIAKGDGFILVTPEYNHGTSAVLKNALDVIWGEWNNKPVGFVSYGGPAGGSRAVEQLRQIAVELEMAPIRVQVLIPRISSAIDANGNLNLAEWFKKDVHKMLDQLVWWAVSLKHARDNVPMPEWMRPVAKS